MADYLADEEQAERLKAWWDRNGTALIVGLALAVAAVVGWRFYDGYVERRADAASDAFRAYVEARALEQQDAGDAVAEDAEDAAAADAEQTVDAAAESLALLDGDFQGSAYHIFSLFYRAADQAEEEDWEEALALLERAVELAPPDTLLDTARYRAAKLLYQLDRLDECEAMLAQVRSSGFAVPVAELSGDVQVARGDLEAAEAAYQSAIDAGEGDADANPARRLLELKLVSLVDRDE